MPVVEGKILQLWTGVGDQTPTPAGAAEAPAGGRVAGEEGAGDAAAIQTCPRITAGMAAGAAGGVAATHGAAEGTMATRMALNLSMRPSQQKAPICQS